MLNRRCLLCVAIIVFSASCGTMGRLSLVDIELLEEKSDSSRLEVDLDDGSTFAIECAGYFRESGKVITTSADVPVVRIGCGRVQANRGTAIWLIGGPFSKIDDDLLPEQLLLLELGYDLVLPMYPGTAERKYQVVAGKIDPDLRQGFTELGELIKEAKSHGPVLLVGESFGALFALHTAKLLRFEDQLILLGPMVVSLRDAMAAAGDPALPALEAAMQDCGEALSLADGTRLAIANDWEPSMAPETGINSVHANTARELAVLVSFFGDWLVTSPLVDFENPNGARVLVIAGERDPLIGEEILAGLSSAAGSKFTRVMLSGQGHGGVRSLQEIETLRNYLLSED